MRQMMSTACPYKLVSDANGVVDNMDHHTGGSELVRLAIAGRYYFVSFSISRTEAHRRGESMQIFPSLKFG